MKTLTEAQRARRYGNPFRRQWRIFGLIVIGPAAWAAVTAGVTQLGTPEQNWPVSADNGRPIYQVKEGSGVSGSPGHYRRHHLEICEGAPGNPELDAHIKQTWAEYRATEC